MYNLKVNTSAIVAERLMKESDVVAPCIFLDTVHISLIHDAHVLWHQKVWTLKSCFSLKSRLFCWKVTFSASILSLRIRPQAASDEVGWKITLDWAGSYNIFINCTNGPYTFHPDIPPYITATVVRSTQLFFQKDGKSFLFMLNQIQLRVSCVSIELWNWVIAATGFLFTSNLRNGVLTNTNVQ